MEFFYKTKGTCSRTIRVVLASNDTIEDVQFVGGCDGNLKGIAALVKGQDARSVIDRISGIRCEFKSTSCPDQLAHALREALDKKAERAAS